MTITATYSPDDNRLRLSASSRLDPETYARVKATGYSWAPRLEQFIAPAWTPQREDLALELAGEIEDEDSTLMDRAEDRAERFGGYHERRAAEAERAREAVSAIADNIPFGQPILVGHHSERHARRDAEKIQRGMRKAVDLWKTSEYWKGRAAAAIRHAKYKERPDVRARRIKGLEADERKEQRDKKRAEQCAKLWATIHEPSNVTRKDGAPSTAEQRAAWIAGNVPGCSVRLGRWDAYDVLRPHGERYKDCPAMTVAEVQEAAAKVYAATIAHCDRWLAHLANRLEYERAMLAESGYKAPEKLAGKAALPLLNYSGTVSYRNPYHPGEVTTAEAVPITKAQLAAIHADYKGTRISACGTHRVRTAMYVPGQDHGLCVVYLTDSKQHERPPEVQEPHAGRDRMEEL